LVAKEEASTEVEAEAPPVEEAEAPAEGAAREPSRRRRRRGRKPAQGEGAEAVVEEAVSPGSSPMVERPIDEEPAIAETQPLEEYEPEPKSAPKAKRGRRRKAVEEAEIAKPEPAETTLAETADEAEPPAKPARKRRTKAAPEPVGAEPETPAPEPVSVPAANNDTAEAEDSGEPRRGWWQRTFG
jgi:ribonuclease E